MAIGFANTEFKEAIQARPTHGRGVVFTAFVIPEGAKTVRRER